MLSNTCAFRSGRATFCPGNPPYVASNSNGLSAVQIPRSAAGANGIMFGYDHMKLKAVVRGSRAGCAALKKPDCGED